MAKQKQHETWYETTFELSNGTTIEIVHNIPQSNLPNINTPQAALDNWLVRTDNYTAQSFVNYINSKGVYQAMTREEYNKLLNN